MLDISNKEFWLSLDSGAHSLFENYIKSPNDTSFRTDKNLDYSVIRTKFFKNTLDDYIAYLHTVGSEFRFYVTLDVLGHPKYTWDILKYMESSGLKPIPVFHLFEDFSWLSKMIDNYDYIGVGVVNKGNLAAPFQGWIRKVFEEYVLDSSGKPRVKVHGFAANALDILKKYPFYSCDASTWNFGARLGHIQLPDFIIKNGEVVGYDYFPSSIKSLPITDGRIGEMCHYDRLKETELAIINTYIDYIGADPRLLRTTYLERDYANALFFVRAEKELKKYYKEVYDFERGGNIYLAGTLSSSTPSGDTLMQLITRVFEKENTLRFLLSFWYENYANLVIATKKLLDGDEPFVLEDIALKKESITASINTAKKAYRTLNLEEMHIEDLTKEEIDKTSFRKTAYLKKTKENNVKEVGFDLSKIKRIDRSAPVLEIRRRPMPAPKVEEVKEELIEQIVEQEMLLENLSEALEEVETEIVLEQLVEQQPIIEQNAPVITISVTPVVALKNIKVELPEDVSIKDLNDLVSKSVKDLLSTLDYDLVSLSIEEKFNVK